MKRNFKPYINNIFIETGSAGGDGIHAALKAKFPKIHSIEVFEPCYLICKNRYGNRKRRVKLYHGDSLVILPQILSTINEPCTFWLDAHYCGGGSGGEQNTSPLMDELKIIGNHHIKTHTILIDDIRLIKEREKEWFKFPYCICDIEEYIHSINPKYKITYDFGEVPNDILIAQVINEGDI